MTTEEMIEMVKEEIRELDRKRSEKVKTLESLQKLFNTENNLEKKYNDHKLSKDYKDLYDAVVKKDMISWVVDYVAKHEKMERE